MCAGCWEQMGKPSIRNVRTETAVKLIARVYEHNDMGGNLHIVLDDWNLEDDDLSSCEETIFEKSRADGPTLQYVDEATCCAFLGGLTKEERASALAIHEGYLKSE